MAIDRKEFMNKIKTSLWANSDYTIFYYNFRINNKRYEALLNYSETAWGKKDRIKVAERDLLDIQKSKKESLLDDNITLDAFMSEHFKHLLITKYTTIRKSHYNRYVSPICGKKKVVDLRQLHIKESIKYQEEQGLAPRTIKQTIEVLSPAFKSAIANRLIIFNPLDGIKIKLPKTKKIVVSASEKLKKIYKAINEEFHDDPFYYALFLFALQGRRRGEILSLRWEDVSFENNYYVLRNTKNNEEQKIFLPEITKEKLSFFRRDEGWVFLSRLTGNHLVDIRKITDRLKRRLNDKSFGIHYLRNVIVSAMAEQGFDSIHLSGALGHNNPNTITKYLTMNYLKSSEMASETINGILNPPSL
ncbi:MAG: tyrosine-type recombinase/integrase [Sulfurospirillum sp.]|nr:tyrosine-type recombinase/integrase [Sulfurospirillum sp.]